MVIWPAAFTTEGEFVRLVPLAAAHAPDLQEVVAKSQLHKLWYTMIPEPDNMLEEITRRQNLCKKGNMLPFTIIEKTSNKAVGMTTYMNIDAATPRLEIGSTWVCPTMQKTGLNTECKLLLLEHAFEELKCIAVEFRTHFINHQSRRAIERLGAKLDGVLRNHTIMKNGTIRDTAVYSILSTEWPAIKANLSWQLEKPRGK